MTVVDEALTFLLRNLHSSRPDCKVERLQTGRKTFSLLGGRQSLEGWRDGAKTKEDMCALVDVYCVYILSYNTMIDIPYIVTMHIILYCIILKVILGKFFRSNVIYILFDIK